MRQSNYGGGVPAGQPPSEAWLFAQELLGNPVPVSAGHDPAAELEYREWLAQISPRHEEELRKRRYDEHEARRKREHLEWLAAISEEHEATLRDFLQQEANASGELQARDQYAEQWDPAKHPRRGGPPNAGWFAGGGGGAGAGGGGGASSGASNEAPATASATPEMLDLARAWWHTNEALEKAKRELRDLPENIARERALYDQGGRYMYLHAQHVADGQKKLGAAKQLAPELEKQLKDLEQAYHDSGYDEIEYAAMSPWEKLIGGKGIEDVGFAAVNQGSAAGLKPTGIEVDLITAAMATPAIFRAGKAVLGRALGQSGGEISASSVDEFVATLPRKRTTTKTPSGRYEIEKTGPYNYILRSGDTTLAIDGYRSTTILEAKHAGKLKNSPYIPKSSCSQFFREKVKGDILHELRRADEIIKSGTTPFKSIEMITNTPESKKYLESLVKESGVKATVRLAP